MSSSPDNRLAFAARHATPYRPHPARWTVLLSILAVLPGVLTSVARADEEAAVIEKRLSDSVKHLASDEMEGRGVGTKGIDLAAEYIARQFNELGLKTDLFDGTAMQGFSLPTSTEMGPDNKLTLLGPPGEDGQQPQSVELKPGEDFTPMMASGSWEFDLPLVFAGYGITGEHEAYDDYAQIDVKGKMLVVLRHEPQRADAQSVFDGTKTSAHAPFQAKIANARKHEAAGVIFCTDRFEIDRRVTMRHKAWQKALDRLAAEHEQLKQVEDPSVEQIEAQREKIEKLIREVQTAGERLPAEYDPLLPFRSSRGGDPQDGFPVIHCRREVLDRVVSAVLDTDLATLEKQIDEGPKPQSRELTGWKAVGRTDVKRKRAEVKNVVAVLDGEGPLAEETIVIGAHYDHLGFGRSGSSGDGQKTVYNGADDNASGVAGMIEIARSLAAGDKKLRRRVVFVAFAAEERGLLGSRHYVDNPVVPLEKTVAMLNLDMLGRLREEKLTVTGTGTAEQFDELLDRANRQPALKLTKRPSGFGPSDHASFYRKQIPVMHFFTGGHQDLHRPTDDFQKINVPGMRRICRLVTEAARELADADGRPEYVSTGRPAMTRRGGTRPYLGTVPDFSAEGPGYAISEVTNNGPAEKAGIQGGDAIIRFGDTKIGSLDDIDAALRKQKPGDRVKLLIRRGDKEITLEVTLDPPR